MNYIILSRVRWEDYEYRRLLRLLPEGGDVVFAGTWPPGREPGSGVRALSLAELRTLDLSGYTLLVSSPYWLPEVLALAPAHTVALLERCPEGENAVLWQKYSALLAAAADLVGTVSERIYLEQTLSRGHTVYLGGDDRLTYGLIRRGEELCFLTDYEEIWTQALRDMFRKSSPSEPAWPRIQLRLRGEYYRKLCAERPDQPALYYLAASYFYLLDDESASAYLTRSFELMLLHGHADILHSHYRFFAAIEAKQGNLELASGRYAITAFTDRERACAARMSHWLDSGREELVRAELYRVNEDTAAAIRTLAGIPGAEARLLLLLNYIDAYEWERALALGRELGDDWLVPGVAAGLAEAAEAALAQLPVIEGTLHLLGGRRHAAIRSFLRAAGAEQQARPLFTEMADLEEAVARLKGGEAG